MHEQRLNVLLDRLAFVISMTLYKLHYSKLIKKLNEIETIFVPTAIHILTRTTELLPVDHDSSAGQNPPGRMF